MVAGRCIDLSRHLCYNYSITIGSGTMSKDYSYMIGNKHAKGAKPNKTAFKKGHTPWMKGRKGTHNSPETEFKKGCKSRNRLEVGTITQRTQKKEGSPLQAPFSFSRWLPDIR